MLGGKKGKLNLFFDGEARRSECVERAARKRFPAPDGGVRFDSFANLKIFFYGVKLPTVGNHRRAATKLLPVWLHHAATSLQRITHRIYECGCHIVVVRNRLRVLGRLKAIPQQLCEARRPRDAD